MVNDNNYSFSYKKNIKNEKKKIKKKQKKKKKKKIISSSNNNSYNKISMQIP